MLQGKLFRGESTILTATLKAFECLRERGEPT